LDARIRDDLIHLGLVSNGRTIQIAEGAEASAGDLMAPFSGSPLFGPSGWRALRAFAAPVLKDRTAVWRSGARWGRGGRTFLVLVTPCVNNVTRYHWDMLRSFRDKETEAIWHRQRSRRMDGPVQRAAWRKLAMLDAAETLADLLVPPGNRLEKLAGDRAGQYSIRINQQWRICFIWSEAGPEDVEIVDYH
jgi:toxin HigB-1